MVATNTVRGLSGPSVVVGLVVLVITISRTYSAVVVI